MMVHVCAPVKHISDAQMDTIGKRLKAARELRRLSQQDFANLGGVQKRAQINYEQDLRAPDAAYLSALAGAGIDVLYVLTGEHAKPIAPTFEGRIGALKEVTAILERFGLDGPELTEILYILRIAAAPRTLSPEQEKLLSSYDNCAPDDQAAIRRLADAAAQAKAKQPGRPKPAGPDPSVHDMGKSNADFQDGMSQRRERPPGPKHRPKPAGPDQPSIHDTPGSYAAGRKKPPEAA